MPGGDERFQVCDQSRSRHPAMNVGETSVMKIAMSVLGFVVVWLAWDSLANWLVGSGKFTPRRTLTPWRAWRTSQKKKKLVLTVNTVGRQLKTACMNQIKEQAGEEVESPQVYFGGHFPDVDWDRAVKDLKTGWRTLRDNAKRQYPSLSFEEDMPHFDWMEVLPSCSCKQGGGEVVRLKPLQR